MNLNEFLRQAGDRGPCVGIYPEVPVAPTLPIDCELRTIHGSCTRTVGALYDAFAEVWHFPPWFGRNMDAFDDFMRDLDNMINTAGGKPPAPGYFTHITDAHLILADQLEAFPWFAKCMAFYRDYYRDEASPPAAFGLLLSTPPDRLPEVRERWLTADVLVVPVET
jgi:hypothetical protein